MTLVSIYWRTALSAGTLSLVKMAVGRIIPLGAVLCLGVPLVAQAQGSAEPRQDTSRPAQGSPGSTDWLVEEIVVTARKREEGLQSAPLSISAFTGEALEYRGVRKIDGLVAFTPNLSFGNSPTFGGASNAAAIYIRGIGQKEFVPTVDPGVGLYVDGVYIARSVGGILDLIDIERVEVLRGPQGTLFGRNTIGGAIAITTRKPHDEFSGRVFATLGTDSRLDVIGSVNIPWSDSFFSTFSLGRLSQDGHIERDDGIDLGDDDTWTGRAAFRWLASDDVEINFSFEGTRDRENGPAFDLIDIDKGPVINRATGLEDPNTPPFVVIHNQMASFLAGWPAPGLGAPTAYPPCVFLPGAIPGVPSDVNLDVPGCYDDRYIRRDGTDGGTAPAYSDNDQWGVNFTLDWALSDSLSIKSITAYREFDADFARDGDHSPFAISAYVDHMKHEQFSQELQLNGAAMVDGRLNWILGLYYFEESAENENLLDFTISQFRSGGTADNTSWAAFLQGTYDLTDRWHLTVGLRYTDEEKKFTPNQVILLNKFAGTGHPLLDAPFMQAGEPILPHLEKAQTIEEVTPAINLSFDWTERLLVYASYSEGFKSGGFTQRVFPPIVAGFTAPAGTPPIDLIPGFDPEYVEAYEVGFKYSTPGQRMRLNGAMFTTEYDDLQVQVFTSVAPVTKNAASATIDGFELELQAVPADGWFAEATVGYLDAGYDDLDTLETRLFESDKFERIPQWSVSAGLSKEFVLSDIGTLTPRIDWSWRSEVYYDAFNAPQLRQPSYALVDANLTFTSWSDRYDIVAAVRNATDEEYMITGIWGAAMQSIETIFDRGREYMLTARVRF